MNESAKRPDIIAAAGVGAATLVIAAVAAIGDGARKLMRKYGQNKLQKKVNESIPTTPVAKEIVIDAEHIKLTTPQGSSIDLSEYQEMQMDEKEKKEWDTLLSALGSESMKAAFNIHSFNGLLKCDVPIKDLCHVSGNPDALRGFVSNGNNISRQAAFTQAGLGNVAPLLVYQCMAAVTSQYFQCIITERLDAIDTKLCDLLAILKADDIGIMRATYNRLKELSLKSSYDLADKMDMSACTERIDSIREKYRELLSKTIHNLNVDYQWSDKSEAIRKIQRLQESHYFEYLDIAMQAEVLISITSLISIRIATFLGNDEDVRICANRISFDFWNKYIDQFNKIKHDVIKYLELQAKASWFQGRSITSLKDDQIKKFNDVESSMRKLQDQLNLRTIEYVKVLPDGTLKKYIRLSQF